jgi:hypothetical protein
MARCTWVSAAGNSGATFQDPSSSQGGTDTFVFGAGANVHHADRNDPRVPQLTLDDVDRCPTCVRFVQGGWGAWKVLRASDS